MVLIRRLIAFNTDFIDLFSISIYFHLNFHVSGSNWSLGIASDTEIRVQTSHIRHVSQ